VLKCLGIVGHFVYYLFKNLTISINHEYKIIITEWHTEGGN